MRSTLTCFALAPKVRKPQKAGIQAFIAIEMEPARPWAVPSCTPCAGHGPAAPTAAVLHVKQGGRHPVPPS